MRLLVGAQLDPADIAAVEDGADLAAVVAERLASDDLWDNADEIRQHRLHVLAWLAREKRLEIKVGVPRLADGTLVPATETSNYFHDKFGIFTDGEGRRVAFIGSNNDSLHGWLGNSESFSVVPEWNEGAWEWNGIDLVHRFEQYWRDEHSPGWKIVPLPDAVRDSLLRVAEFDSPPALQDPEQAPSLDDIPLREPSPALADLLATPRQRPFTGVTSAGVEPLPHQRAVIDRGFDLSLAGTSSATRSVSARPSKLASRSGS